MIDRQLVEKVEAYAKPYCEKYTDGLELWKNHVRLVRQFTLRLAEVEGVNPQIVEVAALLHDIGMYQGREDHHIKSYQLSKQFLETVDLPETTKELILECVFKHRTRFSGDDNRIEVKVVQSADVLGALFDEDWQEYCRRTMSKEMISQLFAKAMKKINLDSARSIGERQLVKLEALLS